MKQGAKGGHWKEKEKARAERPVDTADDGSVKVATTRPGLRSQGCPRHGRMHRLAHMRERAVAPRTPLN